MRSSSTVNPCSGLSIAAWSGEPPGPVISIVCGALPSIRSAMNSIARIWSRLPASLAIASAHFTRSAPCLVAMRSFFANESTPFGRPFGFPLTPLGKGGRRPAVLRSVLAPSPDISHAYLARFVCTGFASHPTHRRRGRPPFS